VFEIKALLGGDMEIKLKGSDTPNTFVDVYDLYLHWDPLSLEIKVRDQGKESATFSFSLSAIESFVVKDHFSFPRLNNSLKTIPINSREFNSFQLSNLVEGSIVKDDDFKGGYAISFSNNSISVDSQLLSNIVEYSPDTLFRDFDLFLFHKVVGIETPCNICHLSLGLGKFFNGPPSLLIDMIRGDKILGLGGWAHKSCLEAAGKNPGEELTMQLIRKLRANEGITVSVSPRANSSLENL
jgi:hypothetical protein